MVCTVCAVAPFSAILPLLPMATRAATHSTATAGVVTGTLAVGAIFSELYTPRLLKYWSPKAVLATGFVAMGAAFCGLGALPDFLIMITLGALAGVGLGLIITVISMLVASVRHAHRRPTVLELYSAAVGVSAVVAPPLALLMLPSVGFQWLFAIGMAFAAVGLASTAGLPRMKAHANVGINLLPTVKKRKVAITFVAFSCVTITYGGIVGLTPFVITGRGLGSVAFFLAFSAYAGRVGAWDQPRCCVGCNQRSFFCQACCVSRSAWLCSQGMRSPLTLQRRVSLVSVVECVKPRALLRCLMLNQPEPRRSRHCGMLRLTAA
jgi:MFS family permease